METYLIAGLGNPGLKYKNTRHNAGFMAIDALAEKNNIRFNKKRFQGIAGEGTICGNHVILLKPHTYMNLSGDSVDEALRYLKLPSDHLIVIYDDTDLDFCRLRVKASGSAGTHNGMRSIIGRLKTYDFARVRVGIGKSPGYMDLASFVLCKFNKEEKKQFEDCAARAAEAVETLISDGIEAAQSRFNGQAK